MQESIRIPQELTDNPIFQKPELLRLFMWLLFNADNTGRVFVTPKMVRQKFPEMTLKQYRVRIQQLCNLKLGAYLRAYSGAYGGAYLKILDFESYKDLGREQGRIKGRIEGRINTDKDSSDTLTLRSNPFQPTIEEVEDYIRERGYSIDAQYFYDFYNGVGWKRGEAPIVNWKSIIETWRRNGKYKDKQDTNRAVDVRDFSEDNYGDSF